MHRLSFIGNTKPLQLPWNPLFSKISSNLCNYPLMQSDPLVQFVHREINTKIRQGLPRPWRGGAWHPTMEEPRAKQGSTPKLKSATRSKTKSSSHLRSDETMIEPEQASDHTSHGRTSGGFVPVDN